ncbi:MAG: hypothetical protein HZB55_10920 [Deltaproteobacteria bacterium]|nr:hypothetical protein [Deltaproteobacteria bacterium]
MNTADEVRRRAEALNEEHQAEVLDFIAFLAAKEAEDRVDYVRAAERLANPGRIWTMEEVEQELGLGD